MATWFTSDTHYGHEAIRGYCGRPYASTEEMNEAMVASHNRVVAPDDAVFHLGDFAMGQKSKTLPIGQRLNGQKFLIAGNHDAKPIRMIAEAGFEEVFPELVLEYQGFRILLRHYPLGGYAGDRPEEPSDYDYRFCGHVHDLWRTRGSEINVGVDVWGFVPRSFEELTAGVRPRQWPTLTWTTHHSRNRMIR